VIYNVAVESGPLIGQSAGPFALELQFNDGSGTSDGNNTAILSGFFFGGGGPTGTATTLGGVFGALGSSISMTDSSFFNQFIQGLTPGASLSFQLALTTNVDGGGVPDEFSLSILDSSGFEIPTLGPGNALVIIDLGSDIPTISTYRTNTSQNPNAGGPPIDIAAPQVTPVPEPSTLPLLAIGVLVLAIMTRLRKRQDEGGAAPVAISSVVWNLRPR
jgi:hypothetical protein